MEGIHKILQNKTKIVNLLISLAERAGLEIKEPTWTLRIIDKVNKQYIHK